MVLMVGLCDLRTDIVFVLMVGLCDLMTDILFVLMVGLCDSDIVFVWY